MSHEWEENANLTSHYYGHFVPSLVTLQEVPRTFHERVTPLDKKIKISLQIVQAKIVPSNNPSRLFDPLQKKKHLFFL